MLWSIYDKKFQRIAFLSNDSEKGLHFYDDKLTSSISTGLYTLDFKVPKTSETTKHLSEGNYIEVQSHEGNQLLMVITSSTENRNERQVFCEDSSILTLNGYVDAIDEPTAPENISFYLNHALERSDIKLLNVEVKETRKLSFGGIQRTLERIKAIAEGFDGEVRFTIDFTPGQPPKRYLSILKERVEGDKGFRISSDTLVQGIERKVNIYNIATKLRVRGAQKQTQQASVANANTQKIVKTPEPAKTTTGDAVAEKAIAWAKEYAKKRMPYQWGGNGNPSYDCSGFVTKAWRVAGVSIGGRPTTYSMWAQTAPFVRINRADLKPGDLIMYDTGYTSRIPNHVGMYLGPTLSSPNSVIHAGNPVGITQRADSMSIIGYIRVKH